MTCYHLLESFFFFLLIIIKTIVMDITLRNKIINGSQVILTLSLNNNGTVDMTLTNTLGTVNTISTNISRAKANKHYSNLVKLGWTVDKYISGRV